MKYIFLLFAFLMASSVVIGQYIERVPITTYKQIWDDKGTGNPKDLSFWHPTNIPLGYYVLGSIATSGDNPNGKVITYAYRTNLAFKKKNNQNIIVAATGFRNGWTASGTGADKDGSLWQPICPKNYVPLGWVVNASNSKPSVKYSKCGCVINSAKIIVSNFRNFRKPPISYEWNPQDCKGSGIGRGFFSVRWNQQSNTTDRIYLFNDAVSGRRLGMANVNEAFFKPGTKF